MAKRQSLRNIPKEDSTIPQTGRYYKFCPYCRKNYWSDSRGQKYCCPEHAKADAKKKKEQKEAYQEIAPIERLRVRYHGLAVETLKMLAQMKMMKWECKECNKEGEDFKAECHHKDLNWMNNTPDNLELLCHKCHAAKHSELQKDLGQKGILPEEFVNPSFAPLYVLINKEK